MFKKLFSFIFCLTPIGAMAATTSLTPVDNSANINLPDVPADPQLPAAYPQFASGLIIQTAADSGIAGTENTSVVIGNNDNGITTSSLIVDAKIDVAGGLVVGSYTGSETNWLYILNDTTAGTSNGFSITATGPIKFGSFLQVENGNFLKIGQTGTNRTSLSLGSGTIGTGATATPGIAIDNSGKLALTNLSTFTTTGTIRNNTNATSMEIDAESMTSAAIANMGGTMNINTGTGAINLGTNTITSSDNATSTGITAGNLTSSDIQNGAGIMNINLSGNLTSSGRVENKNGTSMTVKAKNITVAGTMTNERNDGTMTITADSLTVNGGDANNASFVNGGNLYITVTGQTKLANGFDFSTMKKENIFSLTTGTLDTTTASSDNWLHMFSNRLNSFTVKITGSALTLTNTDIINGQAFSNDASGEANPNANMYITAQSVTAKSVKNNGQNLNITADTTTVNITEGVNTITGTTQIVAKTKVTTGAVTNDATTTINGTTGTTIASISNNATGTLNVFSSTSDTGSINITGSTANSGTLNIRSRQITTGNLTNNAGTTNITGSDDAGDALKMGIVTANGGIINIRSLVGDVNVTDLYVKKTTTGGGSLNIDGATTKLAADGIVAIDGDFTLSASDTAADGAMNVGGAGVQNFVLQAGNNIAVGGDIIANQSDFYRSAQLVADEITVKGDVTVANSGRIQFGYATDTTVLPTVLTVEGSLTANNPSSNGNNASNGVRGIEIYSSQGQVVKVGDMSGNGLFIMHGEGITAMNGDINIANNILFDGSTETTGLIIRDTNGTNAFTLSTIYPTTQNQGNISVGGIKLAEGNTLNLDSAKNLTVSGLVTDNGNLNLSAVNLAKLTNSITVESTGSLKVEAATIDMQDLTNKNKASLTASNISTGSIKANAGTLDITAAQAWDASGALDIESGAIVNVATANATVEGPVTVNGNLVQGQNPSTGALNITQSGTFKGSYLTLNGDFIAHDGQNIYNFAQNSSINGTMTIDSPAITSLNVTSGKLTIANTDNNGTLSLYSNNGINVTGTFASAGDLTVDSNTSLITANILNWTGTTTLNGAGLELQESLAQNMLYQNYVGDLEDGDVNIKESTYAITSATHYDITGVSQKSGSLTITTPSLHVAQNIDATDLTITKPKGDNNWLNVTVDGNVSGNTKFIGLESMKIGKNYTYNSNSSLIMAILPEADVSGHNYWATVGTENDGDFGQIKNNADVEFGPETAKPLISVTGSFITQLDNTLDSETGLLSGGKMGVKIFDIVDPGTAIWLLNAGMGIVEEGSGIRNLLVQFCNADGSQCFTYLNPEPGVNETGEPLPAYISVRDTDEDGTSDSLYLVFDPRFGGPVEIFKIQPIVGRENHHTKGEYMSAGALDDMIAGRLEYLKFYNRTPLEAVPFIFRGTNMEEMANQLYLRMEQYEQTHNGAPLSRFSRLFQPRELEQLAGSIALNEHTSFRDFEDHMFDEFIWNRNRNLRKAWGEFDFGMFSQREADSLHADGNRFSFTGGYDWQETETLILGVTGRVSHMSGNAKDDIDLSYKLTDKIAGGADVTVTDTNIGLGAYLLQTVNEKMRVYGNGFLDVHLLDITRDQTYMASIEGDGTSFSLISEWGLLHDWLNQYIVGNVYARVGYSSGFSITETAGGQDYMEMESDGYFIFTPGYSLTAQKRIYPSVWFQIRPYASIGVEYDVLGAPDSAKYKFMAAKDFTTYDIEIDPLWANIGGGMEFLSATGIQVGLDYRYQYNSDIQMHKIKLSGSYRF